MKLLELGTGRMTKSDKESPFWRAMMSAGVYKRNQGKLSRQLTAAELDQVAGGKNSKETFALGAFADATESGGHH